MKEEKNVIRETTENKKEKFSKKGKHKAGPTPGDLIFRVLVLVIVFFIALLAYAFYIQ